MGTNTYGIVEAPDDSAEEEKMRMFAIEDEDLMRCLEENRF